MSLPKGITETIEIDPRLKETGFSLSIPIIKIFNCKILQSEYDLSDLVESLYQKLIVDYKGDKIKESEIVQKYRNFSWHFLKLDPTKNRPSGEALARRIIKSKKFPKINPFVDAYNLASAETFVSASGYDLQKITFPLTLRTANKGDQLEAIGNIKIQFDGTELVISDANNMILTQYLYRDAEISKITADTKEIVFIINAVQHIEQDVLDRTIERLIFYLDELKKRKILDFEHFTHE